MVGSCRVLGNSKIGIGRAGGAEAPGRTQGLLTRRLGFEQFVQGFCLLVFRGFGFAVLLDQLLLDGVRNWRVFREFHAERGFALGR